MAPSNAQRDELHKTIWKIANDLRGSIDGWDFKQYVLGTLFYRYISEDFNAYINKGEIEAGNTDFNYADISDDMIDDATRSDLIREKGYFIYPSELFSNVVKAAEKNENLNETLSSIFANIEGSASGTDAEEDMKGLFSDFNVNDIKLGGSVSERNKLLIKLLNAVAGMQLADEYGKNDIEAFGDAYEYLMSMYAANAGKSGGEYYTPQEVSRLLTLLTLVGKTSVNKVYDPCCGSGSLLLQAAKILGKENVEIGFFGQEKNPTTYNLCRINMWLHDIGYDKFDIARGDTLINPMHWDDQPFESIVTNMPYSIPWEGDDNPLLINDARFAPAGVLAPKSKADLAFVMHCLSWLAPNGAAAIVCFPGIMYRGGAEKKIRKYLVDNNYIESIIQLPENLFFGTPIATCIMTLRKAKPDSGVLFIDASKEFIKVTNDNKLTEENIQKILKLYTDREDKEYLAKLVDRDKIAEEDYNLSVSTYVEKEDTREKVDIVKLNAEIKEIVAREQALRDKKESIISSIESACRSELEELIEELCPDGVEFKKIKDEYTRLKGTPITAAKMKEIADDNGEIRIIAGGKTEIRAKESEIPKANITRVPAVLVQSRGVIDFIYLNEPFTFKNEMWAYTHKEQVSVKYLCYVLKNDVGHFRDAASGMGSLPQISLSVTEDYRVPVPPLEVQREIVRILDHFTLLSAELSAELKADEKQYEYYRDKLLTFEEKKEA